MRYGVSFVDPASDWYSAPIPVINYVISYNIRPGYEGTWLYSLAMFYIASSLAPEQPYDCPSASDVTLKDKGEINWYQTTTKY